MTTKTKSPHPKWATKYRTAGTELRLIGGKYYLYQVSSKWNSEKKRAQKISGKVIGRITQEEGLIPSEKRALRETVAKGMQIKTVSVKEYGAFHYLTKQGTGIIEALEAIFPQQGKLIFTVAFLRLMHQSPIKNMGIYANASFIGTLYEKQIDDKVVSTLLRDIGSDRSPLTRYMKQFAKGNNHVLIDMTHLISYSQLMSMQKTGFKKPMDYRPQINLMYIFSTSQKMPAFYRLVPGNIKEVKAFALSIKESGLKDAVVIGDKGFFSAQNIEELEKESLRYIIPLRRSSSLIDYGPIDLPEKKGMHGFFQFEKRFIWYYSYEKKGANVITFLDEQLRLSEQNDYLQRIKELKKGYTIEGFRKKQHAFGTLTMINGTKYKEEEVYCSYKSRSNIEVMFDAGKNILDIDISYMQNDQALEGWLFIHHIALQLYYMIYNKLNSAKLLAKYSVSDMLMLLRGIKKVKINDNWYLAEMTKPTQALLSKLDIHIT
jgi:transposase